MSQKGRVRSICIRQKMDQPAPNERRIRRQMRPPPDLYSRRGTEKIEREIDARTPARHVILQIRIKPLIAQVQLRSERHHQQIKIELREAVGIRKPGQ